MHRSVCVYLDMGAQVFLCALLTIVYISLIVCQGCTDSFITNGFGVQQTLSQQVSAELEPIGLKQCSRECLLRTNCKAVAFNRHRLRCYIGTDDSYIVSSAISGDIAAPRTTLMQFESELLKSCAGHTCAASSVCVELTNGDSSCVPLMIPSSDESGEPSSDDSEQAINCDDPPSIDGASVPTSADRAVGTVLVYSCQPGYITQGEKQTTCQPDGTWLTPSLTCTICNTDYYSFNQILNFCYRIEDTGRYTQSGAIQYCSNMGGKLAKVDSTDKISELLINLNSQVYVDGTDAAQDGTWVYSEGTMIDMTLFKNDAPSLGNTDCLTLRADIGKMVDISCVERRHCVCEQTP